MSEWVYDKIMGAEGIDSTRVARASLESGDALVGFHLSTGDVPKVKQRLGIGNSLAEASASEILELLCGVIANKDELRGYGFPACRQAGLMRQSTTSGDGSRTSKTLR